MQANLSQSISISDIAQASQVGIRSLQEGFKRFKGMSPMAYLANLRLEAVHRDLIMANSATTVAAIAQKWGSPIRAAFRAITGRVMAVCRRRH
ncbi:helix-turn-helix domain-containing protein [Rhizobium beringeri]